MKILGVCTDNNTQILRLFTDNNFQILGVCRYYTFRNLGLFTDKNFQILGVCRYYNFRNLGLFTDKTFQILGVCRYYNFQILGVCRYYNFQILGFCDCKKFQDLKKLKIASILNDFDFRKLHYLVTNKVLQNNFYKSSWLCKMRQIKNFLIDRANRTRFSKTMSLSDQNSVFKNSIFLKVTVKIHVNSRLVSVPRPKNYKFAPIQKRFRYSGSALLCDQKCPPYHHSNPQGYRD